MKNTKNFSFRVFLLSLCLALGLVACGADAPEKGSSQAPAASPAETPAAPPSATEYETPPTRGEVLLKSSQDGPIHPAFDAKAYSSERLGMVKTQIEGDGVSDPETLEAMRRVPRHEFVQPEHVRLAYADRPLPIGHGQTISQPYIVGYMTEQLDLKPGDRVLEIGAGSAYQAAILAEMVQRVVTIEIVGNLARSAAQRLERLGYKNATVIFGDGYFGWPDEAPYDAIIVTAAAEHIPPPLVAQLKPGGRMAIPVGRAGWAQNLLLVEKGEDGQISTRNLLPVAFVPLTREPRESQK